MIYLRADIKKFDVGICITHTDVWVRMGKRVLYILIDFLYYILLYCICEKNDII